jgi:hypothetical protein
MQLPKRYVSSRRKIIASLIGSLTFVAIAIFVPDSRSQSGLWRYWCGLFFGLCAVVFLWLLIRPQTLTLDTEGFTVAGGFVRSPRKTLWRETAGFFVYHLPRGGKMVGFNFAPGIRPTTALMKLNRRLEMDGAVPRLFSGSAESLAKELNSYRDQFVRP